jgi:hypothetical protein
MQPTCPEMPSIAPFQQGRWMLPPPSRGHSGS